jgi:U3 small nucleolar RNA-associated protein 5
MSNSKIAAAGAASLLTTPSSNGADLLCTISSSGDCVAVCTSDGVIKFYDTLTSTLKQEYASSTHLQASCTCLSWSMHHNQKVKRQAAAAAAAVTKQKKLKSTPQTNSSIESELNDLNLIAIGTAQGAILLYSLAKGALHSQLVN